MERYWVLRVKGRNRWQEVVLTGPKPPTKEAAAMSEEHDGAEVTVFEAVPVKAVPVKAVAMKDVDPRYPPVIYGP